MKLTMEMPQPDWPWLLKKMIPKSRRSKDRKPEKSRTKLGKLAKLISELTDGSVKT